MGEGGDGCVCGGGWPSVMRITGNFVTVVVAGPGGRSRDGDDSDGTRCRDHGDGRD